MSYPDEGRCCLCGNPYTHWGNNPEPLASHPERCCDGCNATKVIPARLYGMHVSGGRRLLQSIKRFLVGKPCPFHGGSGHRWTSASEGSWGFVSCACGATGYVEHGA